jgi:hypothetical protein
MPASRLEPPHCLLISAAEPAGMPGARAARSGVDRASSPPVSRSMRRQNSRLSLVVRHIAIN